MLDIYAEFTTRDDPHGVVGEIAFNYPVCHCAVTITALFAFGTPEEEMAEKLVASISTSIGQNKKCPVCQQGSILCSRPN